MLSAHNLIKMYYKNVVFLLLQVRRITAGELYLNPVSNTLIFRVAGGRTRARVSPLPFRLARESNLC